MKAFFLDRDGVINESHSVNTPEDFRLIFGVTEAVKKISDNGYKVFVVTNQGGVGLGFMKEHQLTAIHDKMKQLIAEAGGALTDIRACIHKPKEGCLCRKPKPGMMQELIDKYGIDPAKSYMVGDRDVDITAGKAAGLQTIFVGPGHPGEEHPDYIYPSLYDAIHDLEEQGKLK